MEQPEIQKLLRSGAAALPLTADPWGALANGLRLTREDLGSALNQLSARGIVLGWWLEPNPARQDFADGTALPVLRWSSSSYRAQLPASGPARWFKVGLPLVLEETVEALLGPDPDRTYRVEEALPPPPHEPHRPLVEWLSVPRPADVFTSPWDAAGEAIGMDPADVVSVIRRLIIHRIVRRFSLRVAPAAAGWNGCGLAEWELPPEIAPQAAESLAAIRATGDVWTSPRGVHALFLARTADLSRATAEAIATQWSRPLARWQPLAIE